jgi:hypothetical protein
MAGHRSGWLALASIGLAALLIPQGAVAETVVAKTNKKGTRCEIQSFAVVHDLLLLERVDYGFSVPRCKTRSGVRFVDGDALLYLHGIQQADAVTGPAGQVPFTRAGSWIGTRGNHHVRASVGIVIRGGKHTRKHRRERWRDPGPNCSVSMYRRPGDLLSCVLVDAL